ncbi:MAG: hypothetical protein LBK95_16940, partial [Bifidobacteriaceae bacterium]|nr:hypothetical protein [Bifidobacteriaceae bacterium]
MTARAPSGGGSRFDDPERLRRTLLRLHAKGKDAWRDDPDADELARYAMDRFAALATKHGLDPADGGSAAFEAMRNPSVVLGENPWAVIVHAVKTTMAARQFADEALCSVETARRGGLSGRRAERFSDRETPVWERHPAFARLDEHPGLDEHVDGGAASPSVGDQAASVAGLLAGRGWPVPQAAVAAEVVLRRLADCG